MTGATTQLPFIQRGRATVRYHGMRMHDHQRIDAHSYGVAMLCLMLIGPEAHTERKCRLMQAALLHDLAEHIAGDLPAPTKRHLGIREMFGKYEDELMDAAGLRMEGLLPPDQRVLKMADAVEGCLHCIEERQMGNQNIRGIFYTFWKYATGEQGMASKKPYAESGEWAVRWHVAEEWTKANGGVW